MTLCTKQIKITTNRQQ